MYIVYVSIYYYKISFELRNSSNDILTVFKLIICLLILRLFTLMDPINLFNNSEIRPVDHEIIVKNDFSTLDQSWLRCIMDRSVQNTI